MATPNPTNRKNAAIVVGHAVSSVEEQAAGLYARQLAEAGFVTLTFDAAYQGESDGSPRRLEDPYQRVEDFKNAVTYLSIQGRIVGPQRIGVVGICGWGGYVICAAQTDAFTAGAAVAVVSPEQLADVLQQSTAARIVEARGEELTPLIAIPDDFDKVPAEFAPKSMHKEAWDYYKTPQGSHPRALQLQVIYSIDIRRNYDSFAFNYMISPRPLLMIAGSEADTAYQSRRAINRAREPKELFVVQGQSHVELYDDTSVTIPKLVDFMTETLCN